MFVPSKYSLDIVKKISSNMKGNTFHHHYHILWDIRNKMDKEEVNYVEIGTHSGGSSCLMLMSPKKTNVTGIDLGMYAQPYIIYSNVEKYKLEHNTFNYIIGDSRSTETVEKLRSSLSEIDILFIDGDHSYYAVIDDFLNYKDLVTTGGYIIFDDYHDWKYSCEVQHAVNHIVDFLLFDEFEVIGYFNNTLEAHPKSMKNNNEFILRKK